MTNNVLQLNWHRVAAAVPVPAEAWLFGSAPFSVAHGQYVRKSVREICGS
jgi:hypothetical protein